MSKQNVERVLRGYEAMNRGDLKAATQGLPADFELILPPMLPDVETYRGPEGFRRWWRTWEETFNEIRIDVEEVIDAGDEVVVVMASVSGIGRDSGAEVRTPSFPHVWTLEGDRPVRMEALQNRAAAVERLGLPEDGD